MHKEEPSSSIQACAQGTNTPEIRSSQPNKQPADDEVDMNPRKTKGVQLDFE